MRGREARDGCRAGDDERLAPSIVFEVGDQAVAVCCLEVAADALGQLGTPVDVGGREGGHALIAQLRTALTEVACHGFDPLPDLGRPNVELPAHE